MIFVVVVVAVVSVFKPFNRFRFCFVFVVNHNNTASEPEKESFNAMTRTTRTLLSWQAIYANPTKGRQSLVVQK